MNCDKHMPLHDSGIYSFGTGTSAWRDVSPDQMRGMLQGENPPAFRTALAKTGEDEFGGPWYLDIDSEDIGESIRSVQALLDRFVSIGLDLSCVRIFATGKKGFHIEVPAACIMLEPGPVVGLPRIYRAMALEVFVDGLDMRVYSAGRGRLWRVPNLLRENGAYKVPVTADEVRAMTMESYAELCGVPRPFPPLSAPKYCPRLAALFDKACQRLAVTTSRTRTWTRAEAELRERFSGACPPSLAPILTGRLPSPSGSTCWPSKCACSLMPWTGTRSD